MCRITASKKVFHIFWYNANELINNYNEYSKKVLTLPFIDLLSKICRWFKSFLSFYSMTTVSYQLFTGIRLEWLTFDQVHKVYFTWICKTFLLIKVNSCSLALNYPCQSVIWCHRTHFKLELEYSSTEYFLSFNCCLNNFCYSYPSKYLQLWLEYTLTILDTMTTKYIDAKKWMNDFLFWLYFFFIPSRHLV